MEPNTKELSIALKEFISQFETESFVVFCCYLCNAHVREKTGYVNLRSPVRQLMYLLALFLSTPEVNGKKYDPVGSDHDKIVDYLNRIEKTYTKLPEEIDTTPALTEESNRHFIAYATFLNYYLNATLSFVEQDIDRIEQTFKSFEPFILEKTGLMIEDFIGFFLVVTILESKKYETYRIRTANFSAADIDLIGRRRAYPSSLSEFENSYVKHLTEDAVYDLKIPIEDFYTYMDEAKVDKLLSIFTLPRSEDTEYIYYSDDCGYIQRPIIKPDDKHILCLFSKQLINSTYEYLFRLCSTIDPPHGRKVLTRRDEFLEEKTLAVLSDFFGDHARIYRSYYVNGTEKDLIVLLEKNAYIIECKANKYRMPLRDPVKAFERINDDFKKSIGKGYSQAKEVEDLFYNDAKFHIKNHKGKTIEIIDPASFDNVFTLVVTQERFGQIQCNLAHVLQIEDGQNYPWSIFIDDLESFLITLKRKSNYLSELPEYILNREKLHGRLYCYDEIELCCYFLFDRRVFVENCNKSLTMLSSPDYNLFFDELYKIGFGFKNEIGLEGKLTLKSPNARNIVKKHKLQNPDRVTEYLKNMKADSDIMSPI